MPTSQTIGSGDIQVAISRLVDGVAGRLRPGQPVILLGIANGGIELASRISRALAERGTPAAVHLGTLDISFHRDDIGLNPIPKEYAATQIPVDVDGAYVILIDDVLFSGRTLKAALDELFDHGRPSKVELAVLVDRKGRRLPFAADFIGFALDTMPDEKVVVKLDSANPQRDSIRVQPASAASQPPAL
jgi:pyrimidine operon attenuation protein/uracil phosphoribosyltransferase